MTHLDPTIDDGVPMGTGGTWQGEPHPAPAEDTSDATVADPHSFDVVDLSDDGEKSNPEEGVPYDQGDTKPGWDPDFVMWTMWLIGFLAVLAAGTAFIWHAVDAHHGTDVLKQRTAVELSHERATVAAACQHDDSPRTCIERNIPPGQ